MESFFARFFGGSPAASCAIRFLLAAILSGSQLFGGCAPFALGVVAAAGAGMQGLSALLGLLVGTLLFMDIGTSLKYIAIGVLIFSVSVAFYDTRIYRRLSFMPAVCAMCTASVGFVYLMSGSRTPTDIALFALEIALSAACAFCACVVFAHDEETDVKKRWLCLGALAVFVLIAASAIPLTPYMSLGRVLACALALYFVYSFGSGAGAAVGLAAGLAMDAAAYGAGDGGLFYCAAYGIGAVCASVPTRGGRLFASVLFIAGSAAPLIFSVDASLLWSVPEAAIGCVIFMLLPRKMPETSPKKENAASREPRPRASERAEAPAPETLRRRLLGAAEAFRALYDDLNRPASGNNDENIATVFDRAADRVCRRCAIRSICWEKDYVSTYNALNNAAPALNERGKLTPPDLPPHFASRCINIGEFLSAVNAEFSAMLMRRQYGKQLDDTRRRAKQQYAQMSELLAAAAREDEAIVPASAADSGAVVGAASEAKTGESVSGDTLASFEANGKIFLMLSDGMGCGEAARRESAMTVRLMERFLKSGIEPETALKTLNSAMTLHSDESGSFTTIDLLSFDASSGDAVLYKYGAAPTYVAHGGVVRRVIGETLPAGLSESEHGAEKTELRLLPGDTAVLVSDGTVDADDDNWIRKLLAETTMDPREAAARIVRESREHTGRSDDGSALVLRVSEKGKMI